MLHQKTGFKAVIYLKGKDELHIWAFERRNAETTNNEKIWVAPPEYVILRKLMFYKEGKSEKHLKDIQSMLDMGKDEIDISEIEEKIKQYHLAESWNLIIKS